MPQSAQALLALARESSPERRRALLGDVTDAFAAAASDEPGQAREFAALASTLLDRFSDAVRAEFAQRFADLPGAPAELMSKLAHDVIEVARPVLERSAALSDPELVAISLVRGPEHLNAIARRATVSASVTDALVRRGDDATLLTLTHNAGARFSRDGFETLAERSETVVALRRPFAARADAPIDLLNDMLMFVEDEVRRTIMNRLSAIEPAHLDAALAAARKRADARRVAAPNHAEIAREIADLAARRRLNKPKIVEWMRAGDEPRFLHGLAAWLDIDVTVMRKLWRSGSIEALATAMRASEDDRAFFVTLALHRERSTPFEPNRAALLGDAFETIPAEAARRAVAFWRVRRTTNAAA